LVFITINLYSFILYILNNFLKTNLENTITKGFTDEINPSAIYRWIYSVGISYTHRQIYRRDVAVDKSRYHRWNKNPSVYFKRESFFFGAQISSVKPSANDFFVLPTDIATKWGITDESKADGRNPSVRMSVNKSPTNF